MAILKRAEALRIGERREGMLDVRVDHVRVCRPGRVRRPGDLPAPVVDDVLDLALERLGELLAAAREHLDAVVFERIVRRGNDEPGVEPHAPGSRRQPQASG